MDDTETTDTDETEEYLVNYWVDAECDMRVEAGSEEEAIEEAKRAIEEHMHYGTVSPAGDPSNFQARKTSR